MHPGRHLTAEALKPVERSVVGLRYVMALEVFTARVVAVSAADQHVEGNRLH